MRPTLTTGVIADAPGLPHSLRKVHLAGEFLLQAINALATHESRAAAFVAYDAIVRRLDHQMGVPPHDTVIWTRIAL